MEESKNVKCQECKTGHKLFTDGVITNVWQKDGENHYQWVCVVCGSVNTEHITIEDV